ncbi:MAG: alpha-galactosidase [Nocardioides sp.]|jgi:alpha-galactosidase
MLFPAHADTATTSLVWSEHDDRLATIHWVGAAQSGTSGACPTPLAINGPGLPLLGEHAHERFVRPHLRGHRLTTAGPGRSWTPWFRPTSTESSEVSLTFTGRDEAAGLEVTVTYESLAGGALRGRASVTNLSADPYVVEGLEVVIPVEDRCTELLDFTGRHEGERSPQRHHITDGLWLREGRGGRPGLDAATLVAVGTPGFGTTHGTVLACHVAWSGNSVLRVERGAATGTTLGGGEHLLPGEMCLAQGESYASPWVMFAAATDGLDQIAAQWHAWQRSLPVHPGVQPVILNVWEAVYFDHDLERLKAIAERAARVGVERFVLDDGWFRHRRDDHAGLGDWYVDEDVWPDGLEPIIQHAKRLGMEFGLWFEPEMINVDSDLYREHPDWLLSSGDRLPLEHRQQQVLDLTRPEVVDYLFERVSAVLGRYDISYVKWDHNRDLLDAGRGAADGAPAPHLQTLAYYDLLDRLRAAHPAVAWESCASGGGRIDLGVAERVERFWTSDLTDALARQQIQRWTTQLIAPELAGAHVSAPVQHGTWRTFSLDFRAATAMFGAFGIEWDLTQASDEDLDTLASWITRFKRLRPLLHSGRMVRPESADPTVLLHGVVATDAAQALIAHVQLDEPNSNRGVWVRVPGLTPDAAYDLAWEGPVCPYEASKSVKPFEVGPTGAVPMTGADLAGRGFWMPRIRPQSIHLVHLTRR